MKRYFFEEKQESLAERVAFAYAGGWYVGRGSLTWNPESGFELRAFLGRQGAPLPRNLSFGRSGLLRESDVTRIRLRLGGRRMAYTATVALVDRLDVPFGNHLHVRFSEMFSFERGDWQRITGQGVTGWAVFTGLSRRPTLPDVVEVRRRLTGEQWTRPGWSRSALVCGDRAGFRLRGTLHDNRADVLVLSYRVRHRLARRGKWYRWPYAVARALTFLYGRVVSVVEAETRTETWRRRHVVVEPEPLSFGPLALHDDEFLDKDLLRRLSRFFFVRSKEAAVAALMLDQIAAAAQQRNLEATQLLIATILEASLRTLQGKPFVPGAQNTWVARKSLEEFRRTYLDDRWGEQCASVLDAWNRLRHRNAHPTWLVVPSDRHEAERATFGDMMLLSRFYGRMIRALAGESVLPLIDLPRI